MRKGKRMAHNDRTSTKRRSTERGKAARRGVDFKAINFRWGARGWNAQHANAITRVTFFRLNDRRVRRTVTGAITWNALKWQLRRIRSPWRCAWAKDGNKKKRKRKKGEREERKQQGERKFVRVGWLRDTGVRAAVSVRTHSVRTNDDEWRRKIETAERNAKR